MDDAKPMEAKKGTLHWNSNFPPTDWTKPEFDDATGGARRLRSMAIHVLSPAAFLAQLADRA